MHIWPKSVKVSTNRQIKGKNRMEYREVIKLKDGSKTITFTIGTKGILWWWRNLFN